MHRTHTHTCTRTLAHTHSHAHEHWTQRNTGCPMYSSSVTIRMDTSRRHGDKRAMHLQGPFQSNSISQRVFNRRQACNNLFGMNDGPLNQTRSITSLQKHKVIQPRRMNAGHLPNQRLFRGRANRCSTAMQLAHGLDVRCRSMAVAAEAGRGIGGDGVGRARCMARAPGCGGSGGCGSASGPAEVALAYRSLGTRVQLMCKYMHHDRR